MVDTPDLVLKNATFITMDPAYPVAHTIGIKNGKIIALDETLKGKETIDLKGAYVYPGFIDTHLHLFYSGIVKSYLQLDSCIDKTGLLNKVKEHATSCKSEDWILGIGWCEDIWPDKNLHARDLDFVSNPVLLRRNDTHLVWVNSKALQLAGIDEDTADPFGGKIIRDANGKPSGLLIDRAAQLVSKIIPEHNSPIDFIEKAIDECLEKGITTIHDASIDETQFTLFQQLAFANALKVRCYLMGKINIDEESTFLEAGPQDLGPYLKQRCLKLWIDGAMGSRGAALMEPYSDDKSNKGLLLWDDERLIPLLQRAKEKGFQVAIHAIGDRASNEVLNAYEKIGVKNLRWRIEHAQQLIESDIPRFNELGVIASMQPLHATTDMSWLEFRVGKERANKGAFLLNTLLKHNTLLVGGSDAPVVDMNPLLGIHAAITRQTIHHQPEEGWTPNEKISAYDALKMYTINAAYSSFQEHELGSITKGKLADLVVLPDNILTCDPKKIPSLKVLHTYVNGKLAYSLV